MPDTTEPQRPLARRLLWFAALWAGGVLSVASVGYLIKWALKG